MPTLGWAERVSIKTRDAGMVSIGLAVVVMLLSTPNKTHKFPRAVS